MKADNFKVFNHPRWKEHMRIKGRKSPLDSSRSDFSVSQEEIPIKVSKIQVCKGPQEGKSL